jgi:hypothetical protein
MATPASTDTAIIKPYQYIGKPATLKATLLSKGILSFLNDLIISDQALLAGVDIGLGVGVGLGIGVGLGAGVGWSVASHSPSDPSAAAGFIDAFI